jgi:hypothetical protein
MLCIFFNVVTMGCVYKGMERSGLDTINIINNVFLVIFHIEALIKIMAYGWFYFKDGWNK